MSFAFGRRRTAIVGTTSASRLRWLLALAVLLALAAAISLLVGPVSISAAELLRTLAHPSSPGLAHDIAWEIRLPRLLIGACVGVGLGIAGAMLQALFRNPLVDPYLTGVAAGAALAATIGFAIGASFGLIPIVAFAGGLACAVVVALVGAGSVGSGNLRLVLAGVAVSALCSALVTLVLLRNGSSDTLSILSWLAGGLSGRGWTDLAWSAFYLAIGAVAAVFLVRSLNALRLGVMPAAGLGLNVGAARWQVLSVAALITAACVSVSGVVGFVGLMVPHGARRLVGGDMRWLVPASALAGGAVVVVADTFARTLMPPTEIPLGVLLAVVGVPFFLLIARRPVEL